MSGLVAMIPGLPSTVIFDDSSKPLDDAAPIGAAASSGSPTTLPTSDTQPPGGVVSQRSTDFGLGDAPPEPGNDPLLGADLGGIRIERLIGEGGMGRVYAATQSHPARTVAVKVMRAASAGAEGLKRFRREADALARLRHPGIAQIFTAGHHRHGIADVPFYVMEYIPDAEPLVAACERRRLPIRRRLELLLAVCEAVGHGHVAGIVHRDIKPGNVLVDAAGRPKIIDFGIARMDGPESESPQTQTGQFVGTRPYMAPEQFAEQRTAIDARTDVHAIGVLLHEVLTGRLPYDVTGKSLVETARIVQQARPARLVIPGLPREDLPLARNAEVIAARCLAKEPSARYASADAVAADLVRLLAGEQPIAASAEGGMFGRLLESRGGRLAGAVMLATLCAAVVWGAWVAWARRPSPGRRTDPPVVAVGAGGMPVALSGEVEWRSPPYREIRFGLFDADWRRHVVSLEDVEHYTERQAGATTFIRPTVAGREGRIILRFDLPFTIQDATLTAPLAVWTTGDPFPYDPGARAALDVSPDGEAWKTVVELKAGAGGFNDAQHDIGPLVAGGTRIWVRVRLTATKEWPGDGLIFAQFLRTEPQDKGPRFRLTATGPHPPVIPQPGR